MSLSHYRIKSNPSDASISAANFKKTGGNDSSGIELFEPVTRIENKICHSAWKSFAVCLIFLREHDNKDIIEVAVDVKSSEKNILVSTPHSQCPKALPFPRMSSLLLHHVGSVHSRSDTSVHEKSFPINVKCPFISAILSPHNIIVCYIDNYPKNLIVDCQLTRVFVD